MFTLPSRIILRVGIGEYNSQVIFLSKPYFITTAKKVLKIENISLPIGDFQNYPSKLYLCAWNLAECHSQAIVENKSNLALMGNITLNLSLSTLKQVREVFDNLGTALVNGQ